jgi:TonB family protein
MKHLVREAGSRSTLRAAYAAFLVALLAPGAVTASCFLGELGFDASAASEWLAAASRASDDPRVEAEMTKGIDLLRNPCETAAAAAAFRRADKLIDGGCAGCRLGEAIAMAQLGALNAAIGATRAAISQLDGDPLLGRAQGQLATLFLHRTPPAEAEAEVALIAAVEAGDGYQATALARLAAVRLQRQHYAEAVETARRALAADPDGAAGRAGRSTICRAKRAGYSDAPAEPRPQAPGRGADARRFDEPLRIAEGAIGRPTEIYAPSPRLPQLACRARLEGVVLVDAVIDEEGCVTEERVVRDLPMGLGQVAVKAVQGWVFKPAIRNGKRVKSIYPVSVDFRMTPEMASCTTVMY